MTNSSTSLLVNMGLRILTRVNIADAMLITDTDKERDGI